jgi:hypothetical protein
MGQPASKVSRVAATQEKGLAPKNKCDVKMKEENDKTDEKATGLVKDRRPEAISTSLAESWGKSLLADSKNRSVNAIPSTLRSGCDDLGVLMIFYLSERKTCHGSHDRK